MVKQKYINKVLYNLFDKIARTQEVAQLITKGLRNNNYNACLYPKVAKYKEKLYYIYYKNKIKRIPNKKYVNNNGSIYDLCDEIERSKKGAQEKVLELRSEGFHAIKRVKNTHNKRENAVYFVYYKEKTSNYKTNIKLTA